MGYVPPPLQPTSKEFKKRWDAGARTLEELDPALFKWARGQDRLIAMQIIAIIVAVIGALIIGIIIV